MSFQLSSAQRATATKLVAAILPDLPADASAEQQQLLRRRFPETLVGHLERLLARGSENLQTRAVRLLERLERPLWSWLRGGPRIAFSSALPFQREKFVAQLLQRGPMADRLLLSGVLKIIHYHAYTSPTEPPDQLEGVWEQIGYRPPISEIAEVRLPTASRVRSEQEVFAADYLVIGSGAAGSVMAAELAETGRSVILADAGPLPRATELGHSEALANRLWLESHGTLPTAQLPLQVLAGRVVGGGTVLNWGTCLPAPQDLLETWRTRAGFTAANSEAWEHSEYAVRRRLELAPAENWNQANQLLLAAAQKLGWSHQVSERNQGSCRQCNSCSFGCSAGKNDALRTYLLDAERLGVHLLPDCRIELLEGEQGKVERARGIRRDSEGRCREVEFRFRHLILAAGAIHTPALLLRSGMGNSHVGRHLQLHPAAIVLGEFETAADPWAGPAQAIICDQFSSCSKTSLGFRLETVPLSPGLLAMSLPWHSAREHHHTMLRAKHLAGWLVLVHDLDDRLGSITLNASGQPQVRYRPGRNVREALGRGISAAFAGLRAAGAVRLLAPTWGQKDFAAMDNEQAFSAYLRAQTSAARCLGNLRLFSAHQMSSCRLASSSSQGAVAPSGRLFGWQNVYLCDGSVLPTSTGVNPALTIATLSHYLAQQIKRSTN
jgi:choline dehydrogenase-like flavoprotein